MGKQFSSDLKMKAVKYYHKVDNYSKVCKIFECSERSLKRWVDKYEINKTLERKKCERRTNRCMWLCTIFLFCMCEKVFCLQKNSACIGSVTI